jgi:hypothetical protein
VPLKAMWLGNLSLIIARATRSQCEGLTNLDRLPPPPIHRGVPDFSYAPCKSCKTPASQHEDCAMSMDRNSILLLICFLDYPKSSQKDERLSKTITKARK